MRTVLQTCHRGAAALLFLCFTLLATTAHAVVGYVHEAAGGVTAQTGGAGAQRPLRVGDTFDPNTTFRTANNGTVVLKFEDGQLATLRPNTVFRVDDYQFNPKAPSAGRSAVHLVQGALRFVTGVIGGTNRNNVQLRVATATMGIRGTDIVTSFDPVSNTILTAILAGAAALQAQGGTQLVGAGQYAQAIGALPPGPPAVLANAPAFIAATVNAARATALPPNTPVVVASAARAAVAVVVAREAQAELAKNPNDPKLQADAAKATQDAVAATQLAIQQAQTVVTTVTQSGGILAAPPATPTIQPGAELAPSPVTDVQVEQVILPTCTGSPC